MKRSDAAKEIAAPPEVSEEIIGYVIKKLGLTKEEFASLLLEPKRSFHDYHTSRPTLLRLAPLIKLATYFGFLSPVVYEKFVKS